MTDTRYADVSGIEDRLETVRKATGYGIGRIFSDWVRIMRVALERNDDEYADILDRYAPDEEATRRTVATAFSEAMAELVCTMQTEQRPVIGDAYEILGHKSDRLGQHFTPWNVTRSMAEMQMGVADPDEYTPADPMTIADPACGSGRLLVAAAQLAAEADGDIPVFVRGTDIDPVCADMAVVNLALSGIPGQVIHGDALKLDYTSVWDVRPGEAPAIVSRDADALEPGPTESAPAGAADASEPAQTPATDGGGGEPGGVTEASLNNWL